MRIINKLIEYGMYLLAIILPFQTRLILLPGKMKGGFLEYATISLYAIDILIFVLLVLWMINFLKNCRDGGSIPFYWWLIAGLDLFMFASVFYAPDKLIAFYHYFLFLEGVGLFFLLVNAKYKRLTLYIFLSLSLLLQGILASSQFFFQNSPASKWLGMAKHFPGDLGVSVIETFGQDGLGERWLRSYGSFDHPNMLGAFLAIGILLLLFPYIKNKFKKKTIELNLYLLSFYLAFLAVLFSFSRSAWLVLVLGAIFLLGYFVFQKNLKAQAKILPLIIISTFIFIVPFFSYNNLFTTRISGEGRLEEKSFLERAKYLEEGRQTIKNNWLFGVGIGNYVVEQKNERPNDYFWNFQPVHNVFLLVWSEIGIFGLLFFVSIFAVIIIKSIEEKHIFNLSVVLALLVLFFFDHFWWSLHFGILFFWFIIGILIKNLKNSPR